MGRYVLSTYFGHDASLALVGEGKIVHLEAERFTRRKHEDALLPETVRDVLFPLALRLLGASREEVVAVCNPGCGDQWASRRSRDHWDRDLVAWDALSPKEAQGNALGLHVPCFFIPHHLAHAAYAFYTSPHEAARVGAIDGGGDAWRDKQGEVATITAAVGQAAHPFGSPQASWTLEATAAAKHIGPTWSSLAQLHCGSWHAAGTLMAMGGVPAACFPEACGLPLSERDRIVALQRDTTAAFHGLFPPAGEGGAICLAGGCALNGIAAQDLLARKDVRAVHVPPAVHDGGLTVGAALYALHALLHVPRLPYAPETVAFAGHTCPETQGPIDVEAIADRLAQNRVVALAHGRAESGPRALGHRSLLGDPRRLATKDRLNAIKGRRPFRPVAPVVLREHAAAYFDLKDPGAYAFMTLIAPATERARAEIPAGLHLDGSARVQVVEGDSDLGRIVEAFRRQTGVPVLLNTSFNLAGEAMVNDGVQARATFDRSSIDTLVVGAYLQDRRRSA